MGTTHPACCLARWRVASVVSFQKVGRYIFINIIIKSFIFFTILKRLFELSICFFLPRLCLLQFFDELHLKQLHLHYFLFFLRSYSLLLFCLLLLLFLNFLLSLSFLFFDFKEAVPFLLVDHLIFSCGFIGNFLFYMVTPLPILLSLVLNLLGFFPLRQEYCFLDFPFFFLSLFLCHVVLLG